MLPENNQNLNNQIPPQGENKATGRNIILLILLIALVGFGIWFLSEKKIVSENNLAIQNDNSICAETKNSIEKLFNFSFEHTEKQSISGNKNISAKVLCTYYASQSASKYEDMQKLWGLFEGYFSAKGWAHDLREDADGIDGGQFGYTKDNLKVVVSIHYVDQSTTLTYSPPFPRQFEVLVQIIEENESKPEVINFENQNNNTSENLEIGIFIKNIYLKDGKWFSDIDYVTRMSAVELAEFQINKGECSIPGMTKDQIIDYARTLTVQNFENNLLGQHCSSIFSDFVVFEFGELVNQNPLIRTFEFSNNFKTVNDCPEGKNTTILEWKERSDKETYSYSLYGTRGVYVRRAEIKNNQITSFDMVNGCAG